MNKRYYVGGMTCSACANGIEKIVKGISGVKSAKVSLMSKSLDVELSYDLDVATIETEIFSKVTALGYTISKEREEIVKSQKSKNITKITSLICLLLLLPLIYLCLEESFSFQLFDKEISLIIQGVLALAIIILNFSFYTRGVRALIKGVANMDTLVFLSSSLSYIFSVIITILYILKIISIPKVFFEASAMVLVFISIGKWIEEVCKVKTGKEAEKLYSLVPKTALVVKDGEEKIVEIDNLNAGDLLIFKSGDFITVDGIVTSGNAFIDNSSITGESIAVEVYKESEVLSGGIVKNGYIIVKALKVSKDTLFSKIIECAQEAGKSKPPIQRLADKIAGIFVPIVSAIAVVVFVIWMIVSKDVFTSFTHAISVLVVSCPCALGLATPVAILAVSFKGLSVGVLYKNAESVHKISQINCVLLDKTATLT